MPLANSIAGNSFHSHAASNDHSAPFADQSQASTSQRSNAVPRSITNLPDGVLTDIASYLGQSDLKNMRLTHSKFQAPAERNMDLRLGTQRASKGYAQSPNFGRGRQAKTVSGYLYHRDDDLTNQMKQDGKKIPVEIPFTRRELGRRLLQEKGLSEADIGTLRVRNLL